MNNKVVYNLHYAFHKIGFTCLRFNFRGVGRSQGEYDEGIGELSDAAAALDYLQAMNPNARHTWVAGFSFGAWIGMQLLMRRPRSRASSPWRRRPTSTTSAFSPPAHPRA
jgi:alpha/beta superfamily hydrolase